jgi:hypothetical protein
MRVAGLRPKSPYAKLSRAKPGVDATTQLTANTAAKRRCMIVFLALFCLPHVRDVIIQQQNDFICIALISSILQLSDQLDVGEG